MENGFFHRYTRRSVHVCTHTRWLESKGLKELSDWPGVSNNECLYGALLRFSTHSGISYSVMVPGVIHVLVQKGVFVMTCRFLNF